MNTKLISIIIPVYNAQDTIEKTINSIISNKREDLEIITVIDGATDNSLEVCKKLQKKDSRINILTQTNQGAFVARKNGIKSSKGKYIMFIDADDEYINNTINRVIEVIEKYNPDVIRFRYKKEEYDQYKYFESAETFVDKKDFKNKVYPMFLNGYMLNAIWSNCVKREIFDKINFENESVKYGEDLILNLEIFSNIDNAVFLNDILYKYSTTENSITQSKDEKKLLRNLKDCIDVYSRLFLYIQKWDMYDKDNVEIVKKRLEKECSLFFEFLD